MNSKSVALVSIYEEDEELSREQKKFNKLTTDISGEKKKLSEWKDVIVKYQKEYAENFNPLLAKVDELKIDFVKLLDDAFLTKRISKKDRDKISCLISDTLEGLVDIRDSYNLKEIYNRHVDSDFDQDMEDEKQDLKNMLSYHLDVEIDEDLVFTSEEDLMKYLKSKMEEKELNEKPSKKIARKKSDRTLAKEKKIADEEAEVSQSIKAIHRKLALSLHPDKELDRKEADRKTLLMQRINVAYKNNDLLKLLELQFEVEMNDSEEMKKIKDDRIKIYNRILRDQLKSIRTEISDIKTEFNMQIGHNMTKPSYVLSHLKSDIDEVKNDIEILERDLRDCQNLKLLKLWLKEYDQEPDIPPFWQI